MFQWRVYVGVALLWVVMPIGAAAQSALLTSDVNVDITADTAAEARTQAIAEAAIRGFPGILDRLAPDRKQEILLKASPQTISELTRGTEVLDERVAGNRYRATLRVSYDALAVNTLLGKGESSVPDIAKRSSAVLVVPVLVEAGETLLWEKNNAWRATWQQVALEAGGGHIIAPYSDSEDAARITAHDAETAGYEAFGPLIGRYGVAEIAVLKAVYTEDQAPHLDVTRRILSPTRKDVELLEYRADPQEDREALLKRAALDITAQLERSRGNLLAERAEAGEPGAEQLVIIPITTLTAWTATRQKLQAMPIIAKLELRALAASQADAILHYKGTPQALEAALKAANFRVQNAGNYWIVSP